MAAAILLAATLPAVLGTAAPAFAEERAGSPFDRAWLEARAAELAAKRYVPEELPQASPLRKLDYDRYRAIRFRRGASIWSGEGRGFTVDLLPPGFIFRTPIQVHLVVGGVARPVRFTTEVFEYGMDTAQLAKVDAPGYSGFRVSTPINRPEVMDELVVFQGASYFRAVGKGNRYGISARGLAVDTAAPSGEEFPVFREFFIERPEPGASRVVVHALLDSRSVTGAFTFVTTPGPSTRIDVSATLFARAPVGRYGIAPLTSMFLFDASDRSRFDDFRPAVCDSDGLAIVTADGEHVWRPLANPRTLQISSFSAEKLAGFGLLQRKRAFEDFEDAEARYDLRPSLFIEPRGDWGPGRVELVEIPTRQEIHDNVVAYWKPAAALRPGERRDFAYRMHWGHLAPSEEGRAGARLARVVATRAGRALGVDARIFAVDYAARKRPPADLEVKVTTSAGRILEARGEWIEPTGAYRATFLLDPGDEDVAELRMVVARPGGERWGETWLYRFTQ